MSWRHGVGALCAMASCWPIWQAMEALSKSDYLAAGIGLGLAWILGRTGVELTMLADRDAPRVPGPRGDG